MKSNYFFLSWIAVALILFSYAAYLRFKKVLISFESFSFYLYQINASWTCALPYLFPNLWTSDWLEKTLRETKPTPKLVTVVNPGNPSGTYIPEALLKVLFLSSHLYFSRGLNISTDLISNNTKALQFLFLLENIRYLQKCWMLACCR